nr:MAG TPA: hypothetical protein [Caudoviricetes sp.]
MKKQKTNRERLEIKYSRSLLEQRTYFRTT